MNKDRNWEKLLLKLELIAEMEMIIEDNLHTATTKIRGSHAIYTVFNN